MMLSLCIICGVVFSAYDWGRKSDKDSQTTYGTTEAQSASAAAQKDAWDSYDETEEAMSSTVDSKVEEKMPEVYKETSKKVSENMKTVSPATPAVSPSGDKAVAIVTLAKIVGTGTPEERKARIESLKRLSQALAKSQGQNV